MTTLATMMMTTISSNAAGGTPTTAGSSSTAATIIVTSDDYVTSANMTAGASEATTTSSDSSPGGNISSLSNYTNNSDDNVNGVAISLEDEVSTLFPGLTKGQEVIVLAVIAVGALALIALLLRLTIPLLRKKKEAEKEAGSHADSATSWSTVGSVGLDSVTDSEANRVTCGVSCITNHPTLSRLESLNLQEVYVDNWTKTPMASPAQPHSEETRTRL